METNRIINFVHHWLLTQGKQFCSMHYITHRKQIRRGIYLAIIGLFPQPGPLTPALLIIITHYYYEMTTPSAPLFQ